MKSSNLSVHRSYLEVGYSVDDHEYVLEKRAFSFFKTKTHIHWSPTTGGKIDHLILGKASKPSHLAPRHNGWPKRCPFFSLKSTTVQPTIVLMIITTILCKRAKYWKCVLLERSFSPSLFLSSVKIFKANFSFSWENSWKQFGLEMRPFTQFIPN